VPLPASPSEHQSDAAERARRREQERVPLTGKQTAPRVMPAARRLAGYGEP
jgi:hypothetical protein